MANRGYPLTTQAIERPSWTLYPGLVIAAALLALVATVLIFIFNAGVNSGFEGFEIGSLYRIILFTTLQASLSTAISLALGILLAWSLSHRRQFTGRKLLIALLSLSMVLPSLVVAFGLISVLGRNGWVNQVLDTLNLPGFDSAIYGLTGILIAHVYLNLPFIARGLLQRLEALPVEQPKLACSLNLTAWQRFKIVEWPALRASIPGLSVTVFLICFTSFAIVLILGGSPAYNTLEVAIYEAIKLEFDLPRAVILALIQLSICGALVLMASGLRSLDASIATARPVFIESATLATRLIQTLSIVSFALFFLTPLSAVIIDGLKADLLSIFSSSIFQKAFLTSVVIAVVSTLVTLFIALSLATTTRCLGSHLRIRQSALSRWASKTVSLSAVIYLTVPSIVIGFGFFLIAQHLSGDVYALAPLALLTANVLLSLPFAMVILGPAIHKVSSKYDKLAFSLGIRGISRWRMIEWPSLRREIGLVSALSFCFSLGDLGVIALFGNRDFATLPLLLYQSAGAYRTTDAAGIALILLGLTLFAFLLTPKLFERRNDAKT